MHLCLCKYVRTVSYLIFINGNSSKAQIINFLQKMSLHPQKVPTLKVIDWSVHLSHIMTTGFWTQTLCFLQLVECQMGPY